MASKMGGIRGGRRGVVSEDCPISVVQISGLVKIILNLCFEQMLTVFSRSL